MPTGITEFALKRIFQRKITRGIFYSIPFIFIVLIVVVEKSAAVRAYMPDGGNVEASIILLTFLSLFWIMLNQFFFKIENGIFKLPKLFCPGCGGYIEEKRRWVCPYCDNRHSASERVFYEACKKCENNTDLIVCPKCKTMFSIEGNSSGDKAITFVEGFGESLSQIFTEIKSSEGDAPKFDDLTDEEQKQFIKQSGHVISGIGSIVKAVKGGEIEKVGDITEKMIDSFPDEKTNEHNEYYEKLKEHEDRERFNMEKQAITKKIRSKGQVKNLFNTFDTEAAVDREYQRRLQQIKGGRRYSELSPKDLDKLEDLEDMRDRALDNL
jgi:hypothetical protein